jgi:hypothetical protein
MALLLALMTMSVLHPAGVWLTTAGLGETSGPLLLLRPFLSPTRSFSFLRPRTLDASLQRFHKINDVAARGSLDLARDGYSPAPGTFIGFKDRREVRLFGSC